jgi:ubiquinone/menaquinone biosynthesis C-methylase UbiE
MNGVSQMAVRTTQQDDFLRKFLRRSPVFHAFLRAMECRSMSAVRLEPPILDLGCGDGMFGSILTGNCRDSIAFGVDLSLDELRRAAETGSYRSLAVADMANLPFADNQFGAAISNSVFEHLNDIDGALREVFRILKPGGKLALTSPNNHLVDHFIAARILRTVGLDGAARTIGNLANRVLGNRTCLSTEQWKEKASGAGFRSVKCEYLIPPKTFKLLTRICG